MSVVDIRKMGMPMFDLCVLMRMVVRLCAVPFKVVAVLVVLVMPVLVAV
jgi:hypothetical protein